MEVLYAHHRQPRRGPGHPGRLGPLPLGDRKPSSLGEGRDIPGRQIPGQDGKRAAGDGLAVQPGDQPAPHRRPRQHRRRQPPPRPRPAAHAQATSDRMNDFAGSLRTGLASNAARILSVVLQVIIYCLVNLRHADPAGHDGSRSRNVPSWKRKWRSSRSLYRCPTSAPVQAASSSPFWSLASRPGATDSSR